MSPLIKEGSYVQERERENVKARVETIKRTADHVIDAFTLSIPCSMFLSLQKA